MFLSQMKMLRKKYFLMILIATLFIQKTVDFCMQENSVFFKKGMNLNKVSYI